MDNLFKDDIILDEDQKICLIKRKKKAGKPIIQRFWDTLNNQLTKKEKKKNNTIDSLGISFLAWDQGDLKKCTIRRERDNKGKFLPFTNTIQFPATVVESHEKVVLQQDEQGKLYIVR